MNNYRICAVCGNPITKIDYYKPSTYCGDACSDYSKFKTALEKAILKIKPTSNARKVIRGDMFRLCNLLSNGTNTFVDSQNES